MLVSIIFANITAVVSYICDVVLGLLIYYGAVLSLDLGAS